GASPASESDSWVGLSVSLQWLEWPFGVVGQDVFDIVADVVGDGLWVAGEVLPRDLLAEGEVEPVALLVEQFVKQGDVAQLAVEAAEAVIEVRVAAVDVEWRQRRLVLARQRHGCGK